MSTYCAQNNFGLYIFPIIFSYFIYFSVSSIPLKSYYSEMKLFFFFKKQTQGMLSHLSSPVHVLKVAESCLSGSSPIPPPLPNNHQFSRDNKSSISTLKLKLTTAESICQRVCHSQRQLESQPASCSQTWGPEMPLEFA